MGADNDVTGAADSNGREDGARWAGQEEAAKPPALGEDRAAWLPEGMTTPSEDERAAGAQARAELQARSLDMWVETKWWGFQVHMNKLTADLIGDLEEWASKIIGAAIPGIGQLVARVMKLHGQAIKAANSAGPDGVKCSSPWFAPPG
ncbi:hypothetical protein [Streptomyces sp. NPDC001828]|uniref:hypothetical protein n=1 Tax=Streptomyces sp. NPDC001828 TaxID=3364615 RepID=UPI0036CFDDF7